MKRFINLLELLNKSSHFLLGARGVGKSYAIREQLKDKVQVIDLLKSEIFLQLNSNPSKLEAFIQNKFVIIDEIQRIPDLLNEIHRLIEEKNISFLLTGSSARQLKRKGANLLAGRALKANLFPLTWFEIQTEKKFELDRYLLIGGLPKAYLEKVGQEFLFAYVDTYLKEEIQAEALVRNLANYHRFLISAALMNGQVINYTKIANDAQLSPNTVRDYFQILEDTLIGFTLAPYTGSNRKVISQSKFYFFDLGVRNALLNIANIPHASDVYGNLFEHFIVNEIRAYLSYKKLRHPLCFWRSQSKIEVDLVVGHDEAAIEIKSSERISERDTKGLLAIKDEANFKHLILISRDKNSKQFNTGIYQIYWEDFLSKLWKGAWF